MKRYEKLSKEQIIELFANNEKWCKHCEDYNRSNNKCKDPCGVEHCLECMVRYITKDPEKSRWQLCKTDSDFMAMIQIANKPGGGGLDYCLEKVEVEEA